MADPTLRQLEYAVAVADTLHFGRAADAVHVTQPGLSGQIGELEDRLGVRLFERTPRGVTLTPAGSEVIERSRTILREVDDLRLATLGYHGTLRGPLHVAAIPTMAPYLLPTAVKTMRALWPDTELRLQELLTAPMIESILAGELDIGLLAVPYETGDLKVETLADEPFHLALPSGHPLEGDDPLPLSRLADVKMLLLPEGHCLRDHALDACRIAGRVEHSEIAAASMATLTQMVAAGVGATLLPASALRRESGAGSGISTRPLEPPPPGRTIALAWRPTDPRADRYVELASRLRPGVRRLTGSGA